MEPYESLPIDLTLSEKLNQLSFEQYFQFEKIYIYFSGNTKKLMLYLITVIRTKIFHFIVVSILIAVIESPIIYKREFI